MNFDIFKPKTPPLFGLDISSSSVKMLEIVESGKGYVVERHAIEPLPKDAVVLAAGVTVPRDAVVDGNINNLEAVADAVKRGHKRLGTRTKHVAMAVPSGAVITKKIVVSSALREEDLEVEAATGAGIQQSADGVVEVVLLVGEAVEAHRQLGAPGVAALREHPFGAREDLALTHL